MKEIPETYEKCREYIIDLTGRLITEKTPPMNTWLEFYYPKRKKWYEGFYNGYIVAVNCGLLEFGKITNYIPCDSRKGMVYTVNVPLTVFTHYRLPLFDIPPLENHE